MNGEINNRLNKTIDSNNNDSSCKNNKAKYRKSNMVQPPLFVIHLLLIYVSTSSGLEINISNGNKPLKNVCNWKTLKISYSYTNNSYKIISNHKENLFEKSCIDRQVLSRSSCNCRVSEECPFGGKCNSENVVHKRTISQ